MSFAPVLNSYCVLLGCSNKELAQRCGISMSAFSRYRNGKRAPRQNSDVIDKLAEGISQIASERGIGVASSKPIVKRTLIEGMMHSKPLGPSFSMRVDSLMKLLGMKNADVAIPLHLDSSYISRIRRGERTPNDKRRFAEVGAQVASLRCMERGCLKELLALMDAEDELASLDELNIDSALGLAEYVGRWLLGNQIVESDVTAIESLFEMANSMKYTQWFAHARQVEPVPTGTLDHEPSARFYVGKDFIWKAEMDFLNTAAACGAENLYLSSGMPALETELNEERIELYRQAVMGLVNRGCNITVVDDPGRPLRESILVLRLWMPIYMTGKATALYMDGLSGRLFCHVNFVCECCALASEAIRGLEGDGRYYITSLPEDLAYYQKKMDHLLDCAYSLFEIYREDDEEGMEKFNREEAQRQAIGNAREVHPGKFDNLRIMSYQGDCVVLYLEGPPKFRIVIRHPKLRYVISHMS